MKHSAPKRHRWQVLLTAAAGLLLATSASAEKVAACLAEANGITVGDEAANAGVDAAAEAADVGLPVMDVGIVLSLNQVNANLADLEGPLQEIVKTTCDTDDTLSTSASPADFLGWIDVQDTEPQPALIPAEIDGTRRGASAFAGTVDVENDATVRKMELDVRNGYSPALTSNEIEGLSNMEGLGLTGIESEKLGIVEAERDLEKVKVAPTMKDLVALQDIIGIHQEQASMRSTIAARQHDINVAQQQLFEADRQRMYQDDHLAAAKMLKVAG